ncbi:unnamed protein product [Meganyctiphanes norvegica]|uniref:CABIT domain-containing protein n=1 Tax=Meganyctiphanes norvegica TaxID=48144 RepID=A0AAV2PW19_MEGNR
MSTLSGGSSTGGLGGGSRGSSISSRGHGGSGGVHHASPLTLTPRQLLKRATLPIAAHLIAPIQPPGIDLKSPLLLYDTYTSSKVRAVSLRQGADGSLTPVGPSILIPEAYTGWFSVLTTDGQTAPFFTSIQQVVESKKSFFLTRHDVCGYTLTRDESGGTAYNKTAVSSGHVLKLVGVFEDVSDRSKAVTKYAQCLNYRNEVVFLPYNVTGRFYSTPDKNTRSLDHVYLMAQILKNHKLPVTVKLVCGYMPTVPDSFTGLLKLEKMEKEDVILACTMNYEAHATLFEIDVTSSFSFATVPDPMLSKQPIFLKTVSYCEDEVDTWRRQIKVTHHTGDKRSKSLTRSFSDTFVEPSPSRSTRPLSLSFFNDHLRGRNQDASVSKEKKAPVTPDKSRFRLRDIGIENKRDVKVTERTFSYKSYLIKDKGDENVSKKANRKVSKQNTYIFQNGKPETKKLVEEKPKYTRSISVDSSAEYSRVADDISLIPEHFEEESHYSEIGRLTIKKESLKNSKIENNNDIPVNKNVKNSDITGINFQSIASKQPETNTKTNKISSFSRSGSMKRVNKMSLVTPDPTKSNQSVKKSSSLNYASEKVIVHSRNSILESPPVDHLYDIPPTEKEELDILKELQLVKEKNKTQKSHKFEKNCEEALTSYKDVNRKNNKFEKDCLEMLNKDFKNTSDKFERDCLEVLNKIMEDKKQNKSCLKSQEEKVVISVEPDYPKTKQSFDIKNDEDKVSIKIKPEEISSLSISQTPEKHTEKVKVQPNRDLYVVRISVGDNEPQKQSTLRKRESGNGFVMKVKGFEIPDSEVCTTVWDKELNGYVSMC